MGGSNWWSVAGGRWSVEDLERQLPAHSAWCKLNLMGVRSYRDLLAWQQGRAFANQIYSASASWPAREVYGLSAQIRRAAVSIPSNIAEGQGRRTTKDFLRHLGISYGSLLEVETQLLIAQDQGFIQPAAAELLLAESAKLGRILNRLMQSLESRLPRP
jgi:four helix bundle protein